MELKDVGTKESGGAALAGIHIYPVKSCRGTALARGVVERAGLVGDRAWMVVDETGRFLTQRTLPSLARVVPQLGEDALRLEAPGRTPLALHLRGHRGESVEVEIWGERCLATEQGAEAARWFSELLDRDARLVQLPPTRPRPVNSPYYTGSATGNGVAEGTTRFSDGFPFLLLSEASLTALNDRLAQPLPMDRFRPNLVVRGVEAHAEDRWRKIRIGEVVFEVCKPCPRCAIPSIDQQTGEKTGKEPLATLATYRRSALGVVFGQNLVHAGTGEIRVGQEVEVLESGEPRLA